MIKKECGVIGKKSNHMSNRKGSLCLILLCTSVFIITLLGIIVQNTRLFCFFVSNQVTLQKQFYLTDALMAYGIAYIKQNYDTLRADIAENNIPGNSICLELNSWPPESAGLHDYTGRIEIKINNADKKKDSKKKADAKDVNKEKDGGKKADEKKVGKEKDDEEGSKKDSKKDGGKEEFFLSALLFEKQKQVQKITCRVKLHKNSELEILDWKTGWEKVAERL